MWRWEIARVSGWIHQSMDTSWLPKEQAACRRQPSKSVGRFVLPNLIGLAQAKVMMLSRHLVEGDSLHDVHVSPLSQ